MKIYTRTDTEVYTEEKLIEKIVYEEDFNEYLATYVNDNYSFMELFNQLNLDFQEQLRDETISDVILNEYYEKNLEM